MGSTFAGNIVFAFQAFVCSVDSRYRQPCFFGNLCCTNAAVFVKNGNDLSLAFCQITISVSLITIKITVNFYLQRERNAIWINRLKLVGRSHLTEEISVEKWSNAP